MEHCVVGARADLSHLAPGTVVKLQNASAAILRVPMIPDFALSGLRLTELEVDPVPDGPPPLKTHLAFLRMQTNQPAVYTRLAALANDRGDTTYARRLRIERERRRWSEAPTWYGRLAGKMLDSTIRFGFEPARALLWGVGLVATFAIFLGLVARSRQFLVAVDKEGAAHTAAARPVSNPLPEAGTSACGTDYPCFNEVAFAFDTVVPLVNLGQRDAWHALPRGRTGYSMRILLWLLQLAGWGLVTLFVAGFSRVVRNE